MSNLPHIPAINEELVEEGFQRILASTSNPILLQVVMLERYGGDCPICGTPFKKLTINNERGGFVYYEPACRCFQRCQKVRFPYGYYAPGCGRFLIAEKLMNIPYCTSCGDYSEQPKTRKPSSGSIVKRSSDGR